MCFQSVQIVLISHHLSLCFLMHFTGKVDVQFTPRVFPTPMRESKIAEEDDWIAKNRRHLKKHGVLGGNASRGETICQAIRF